MRATDHLSSAEGMSGLALMPFPFLNPWNWGAMTPSRSLAAGVFLLRCGLDNWRHFADAMRASLRHDQDVMLRAIERALIVPPGQPETAASPAPRRRRRRAAKAGAGVSR